MAFNQVTGIVVYIGQPYNVQSRDKMKTFQKCELMLDCTRRDPYTGERDMYENKLMFEFFGDKGLAECAKAQVGQVVSVSFDLRGRSWVGEDGQTRYNISVNPFRVEVRQPLQQAAPQPQYGQAVSQNVQPQQGQAARQNVQQTQPPPQPQYGQYQPPYSMTPPEQPVYPPGFVPGNNNNDAPF